MKRTVFISIVGRPNVGKSTIMNRILGEKIAIVSNKPQTTRNCIRGILTEGEDQFVFFDTPGIHRPQNRLGDYMVTAAKSGMQQGDVVMLVVDVNKPVSKTEEEIIDYLKREGVPSVLVLNKIDTVRRDMIAEKIAAYASKHEFDAVVPVSAKSGKHVDEVMDELSKFLHESEWFFPEDAATDQPMRQYVSEIIREKLLRALDREVPHGIAVVIEEYRDTGNLTKIRAEIICEKQSHKQIIIGKGGEVLKKVGMYSREELEKLTGSKIFLDLWVRVKENWREREGLVSNFGYNKKDIDQ
ncbi:MAG: GTPase Era [Clostridia bacterium]|nr:GTPase Era [Clostridia bacterium]MBQ3228194.1 GTPase Era [Clostridia bacterium]